MTLAAMSLAPAHQSYLLQARQMQALSFAFDHAGRRGPTTRSCSSSSSCSPEPRSCFVPGPPVHARPRGRLDAGEVADAPGPGVDRRQLISASASGLPARAAIGCLIGALGLLTLADAGWAHAIGVVCVVGVVILGFVAVAPAQIATAGEGQARDDPST